MTDRRPDVRNVAIIAHVDHGKTTLVDALLRQTGAWTVKADEAQECVLDSNPQERERGITILAKCTSVRYKDKTINIVDTPGHADFGGEVERILKMVDGALLLVDALDGPMPQTRFVLRKSLELGLHPIVVINKVDRPFADPLKALDRTFALFVDLGATDPQLDFPILYASGREGWAGFAHDKHGPDLSPLFDTILNHVPGPLVRKDKPFQMLVTMIEPNTFVGRVAIGRIANGSVSKNMPLALVKTDGRVLPGKVTKLMEFSGLRRVDAERAEAGDIIALAGAEEAQVGDTLAAADAPNALPALNIDEPTLSMEFMVNDSPFCGREGKFITTRHLRERLEKEKQTNVGLRIEELDGLKGVFQVSGRGELHLSVLIETMRREGFELAVSRPEVIYKEENGQTLEPAEYLALDIESSYQGAVMEILGRRGFDTQAIAPEGTARMRVEGIITARGLIGFKGDLMAVTKGTGLMHHSFHGHVPKKNTQTKRLTGVLVALETGVSTSYALDGLQERSQLFVGPAVDVYKGQIVGSNARDTDMIVNACKRKALTNMRAAGSDDMVQLTPPRVFTLEQAIEFIEDDELVEITPASLRLRKKNLNYNVKKRWDGEEKA